MTGEVHAPNVQSSVAGGWHVTVAADGWLSSAEVDSGGAAVREVAPFDPRMVFASARYSLDGDALEIHRSLMGGRQVYYHIAPDGAFFCASHVRMLRMAGVSLQEDPDRLPELFVYRYVSPPRTLFKGIDQLLAGQTLRFERGGTGWRVARSDLYSPPHASAAPPPGKDLSYGVFGTRTRDALRDAMHAVAPAKDRLHVLASGGLDSSILFRMAQTDLGATDSHSTSYPFETEADDIEKQYALSAADAMGARHRFFVPTTRQFLRGVVEAVSLAEEPVVHTQSVLMMLLLRDGLPGGDGTVVVGQGADGAFGLRIHQLVEKVDRFRREHPRVAAAIHPALWARINPLLSVGVVSRALRAGLRGLRRDSGVIDILHRRWGGDTPVSDPRHVIWALGAAGHPAWTRRQFGCSPEQIISNRAAALAPFANRHVLDALSLMDFLSDVSVTQAIWSKFGEASRKIVYYPFNDPRMMDSAFQTPWEVKLKEPKGLLRDVARQIGVPEFITTRQKANFNVRPERWALQGATFEPLVPLAAKVFEESDIRRMQSTHSRSAFTFWTMLNYAIWKRVFIHGESTASLLEEMEREAAAPVPSGAPAVA